MSPVMDWNDVPVILTADEAADLLRIHPNTLKQLIADGDIPAVKVGRAWRISKDAVQAYVTPVKAAKPWGQGAYRATCTIEPIDMSDRAQAGDVRKLTLVQDLLTACEAALEAIRSDADVDWMLSVESQLCAVIAEARGGEE